MQTFLPYADFTLSARILDRLRLGKQRVETMQILQALTFGNRWENHPAAKMWKGYECALCKYGESICNEWTSRGYKDTCKDKMRALLEWLDPVDTGYPWFVGNEDFHSRHRAALLYKDYGYYSQFGWKEKPELNYVWEERV